MTYLGNPRPDSEWLNSPPKGIKADRELFTWTIRLRQGTENKTASGYRVRDGLLMLQDKQGDTVAAFAAGQWVSIERVEG